MRSNIFRTICVGLFFVSLVFSYFQLVSNDFVDTKKSSNEIALVELELRNKINILQRKYKIKTGLIRKKDSITLRVWDKGLFPIDGWKLSKRGDMFVKELASLIGTLKGDPVVNIESHYDSISPVKTGNSKYNKIKISNYRAAQIANVISYKGIDMKKVSYKGLSDSYPVVKDRDVFGNYIAEAGNLNRRLEIEIKMAGLQL